MAGPLVETKLFIPRPRRGTVVRHRLSERLNRGAQTRLTLLSAPAGFGKTTLLAQWLADAAADRRPVAWLSLDESDGQPTPFWTYVLTALQRAVPGLGAGVLPLMQTAQPPVEAVLSTVINELSAVPDDIHVVLDDYHLVDGPGIQAGMTFLLEHLPPQVHLLISTRADPALPLARLRARGELVEIRAANLRFTLDEVAAYFNEASGLNLAKKDLAALEGRTEGWAAALQLAALSLRGRADVAGFIAGFTGDNRYIVDYLVEEVLRRQPDHIREFLLQTSVLDRLTGPLCDAVTARNDGRAMLESLERANLFVIPLDDNRQWYRYHHLFADVLRTHLRDERRDDLPDLHLRASRWYDQNGEPLPAVRHSLAAGDVEHAAGLIELAIPALRRNRQEGAIRGWIDAVPDAVVRVRPVLAAGFAGALMMTGEFEGVEERLRDAEQWLEEPTTDLSGAPAPAPAAGMVVLDEQELARLPGTIQLYRAALELARGDAVATVRHAQSAIERSADDDHLTRSAASALSGLTFWGGGDLGAAHAAYSASIQGLRRVGHVSDVLGCSITLADIRIAQGRLDEALRTYQEALRLAAADAGPEPRGTADMYVGMSQIAHERDDLDTAAAHLSRSREIGEHAGLPQNAYRWRVAMARIREARGDLGGALQLLDEAQRVYTGDLSPNVRPIPALHARMLAAHGQVGEALSWTRDQHLSADDDLSYLREYEHITLARVLLAQYAADRSEVSLDGATRLLERLLTAAQEGGRGGSAIEILVLQALAHHARGNTPAALETLGHALSLAEPAGYVRVFTDEGPSMTTLLRAIAPSRASSTYVRRLLAARERADGTSSVGDRGNTSANQATHRVQGLLEPLSERERDVLRMLGTDLDGPAIARQLFVSLNTLRTHTKNIYAKLGVSSRREAVRRAGELGLP
ncbi:MULTISPECIES: LuxR C-terminal-related transcriptional regulator [unclassified Pseudofrankia]|uniref:LuxR C-terminal-related transcriptional regulator n=1 Tax=unclassified Pseudofrankia TaxID=2994372 RepID=UPI0008DABA56|nr:MULTISPECIES: LuxR C-terminal-related transcriptional regulator [unclassified Pseudofrankia]MDT3438785.1 LuxR C-terminal-related transcriptional regulator [Pseudofrankia sp. BMG5.37]OHV75174.1 helix-turn-helix transcriptional regulator [Pseudofrankia sp. BMG5.36]